ncbi:MAG: replication-associated recombination protein A [Oscillospiraceae bacterium]|nr:replication-associated recombination protein A [Oscillospiraceae bacterium]
MSSPYRPLADEVRPLELDQVVGQEHILGPGGILRRVVESGQVPNMIFYGPSGVGKSTVASIIARQTNRTLHKLNATTAGIADIKEIIAELDTFLAPGGVLLYLDEIQYFNKKQQQSLLEFMENGKITLIASTTENPYFYVFGAVLSRATVFEFKPLTPDAVRLAVERAIDLLNQRRDNPLSLEDGVLDHIVNACGGDVRKALNAIELLFTATAEGAITLADAQAVSQRSAMRYDRDGDEHYDILSAFQKSIRGSDPDAAIHYLARLLEAGDLISPCRRMLVTAAEDIGLAHPQVLPIVKACVDMAREIGLPEARIPLANAVILLATSPKSNTGDSAISRAMADIQAGKHGDVPDHLKDSHYAGAAKMGRGLTYEYPHAYPNRYVKQQYLPDRLKDTVYYEYGENKTEQAAKRYWDGIKGEA